MIGVSLTFLGQLRERWRVRVELAPGFRPRGLTVGLVSEAGRSLGPVVVMPEDVGCCWVADLRGPCPLPPGAKVVATADLCGGGMLVQDVCVDARRGLHAFLHGDGRLPLETDPVPEPLDKRDLSRLAAAFPWIAACGGPAAGPSVIDTVGACAERPVAGDAATAAEDDLLDMLREDFGVDVDDLDEDVLDALRR